MWSAQSLRKVADKDWGPKQRAITAKKFCVIQTMSMTDEGK
jgi:hypothetical protein